MTVLECMICGGRRHVLREGGICLCTRCVGALGEALGDKLRLAGDDSGTSP